MALDKEHKYVNQVAQEEHDDTANVELKKVGGFGWNSDSLEWKRLSTDANGKLNVNATASIDTTGLATSTKQSDGSQKTQIVDAGGEVATVTGGKLDVNATASLAGTALPISGATDAVGVAIVDGSGNQITSFGGGTQYTEGDTDATITGTAIMFRNGATNIVPVGPSEPLPISGTVGLDLTGTDFASQSTLAVIDGNINSIDTRLASLDSKSPALGQALAADSIPVILPSATITTLTPPAAITGFATETTLGSVKTAVETIDNAIAGTEMQVDIVSAPTLTVNAHAVTNAGTFATQVDGAALTALQLIDDSVYTDGTGTVTKGIAILGQDGTNPQAIKTDAAGELQVDVLSMPTTAVTGTFWQATQPVSGTVTANATLAAETTKVIGTVNIAASQTVGLAAGTAGIGKLTANSGVDIGDVDVTSLPALPAGTNAIGKLLPSDIDVTAHTNYARKYYTNAGAVTDGIIWSPAAGKRWHVVTMYIQTSAAATITLEDDKAGGDDPVWKGELAANSGAVLSFTEKYPMASGEDAADLLITTTAGNVYCTVVGYEI